MATYRLKMSSVLDLNRPTLYSAAPNILDSLRTMIQRTANEDAAGLRFVSALHHCLLVFQFLADQIFYRSYVSQQHFRLLSFVSLCLDFQNTALRSFDMLVFNEHQMTNLYLHSTIFNLSLGYRTHVHWSGTLIVLILVPGTLSLLVVRVPRLSSFPGWAQQGRFMVIFFWSLRTWL